MKYFWDTLLDADLESDALGWQYISGTLPDGREFDRIDNPQVANLIENSIQIVMHMMSMQLISLYDVFLAKTVCFTLLDHSYMIVYLQILFGLTV